MSNDESSSSGVNNLICKLKGIFSRTFKVKPKKLAHLVSNYEDSINAEEHTILKNVITFKDLEAADIMVPRIDIAAVPINITPEELKKVFLNEIHTRLPVYKKNIDEIEGFIHLRDFFKYYAGHSEYKIKDLVRNIIFIPGTMKVSDLLTKMKQAAIHIAIVLDEYGGTNGMITIEDVIEQVVGDITDEYDEQPDPNLITKDGDSYIIEAKTEVEQFEEYFNISLEIEENNQEYDTIGGMITTYLGMIPTIGDSFVHPKGFKVEIMDADNRKIKKVKITGLNAQ